MSIRWSATVLVFALALAGCGIEAGDDPDTLGVVVTTSILGDVVGNVLGDHGTLQVMMPAGIDPHSFEPSAADAARLREADLVVVNGLQLEVGLLDALQAAEADGVPILRVADELDPIAFAGEAHGHEEDEGGDHGDEDGGNGDGALDPHVWFDPVRMAAAVTLIAERLAEVAPSSAELVRRNAEDYRQEVLDLHDRVGSILAPIPPEDRELVTNHDSLGYLAARYDLAVVGTVVPGGTTLGEASSREIAELVEAVRTADVPAIFVETTAPDRLAQAVSRELGGDIEVIELYTGALGPEGSGAETYIDLIETDARRIADALTR